MRAGWQYPALDGTRRDQQDAWTSSIVVSATRHDRPRDPFQDDPEHSEPFSESIMRQNRAQPFGPRFRKGEECRRQLGAALKVVWTIRLHPVSGTLGVIAARFLVQTLAGPAIFTLAGLRSRWMMPFSWAASSASAIWRAMSSASSRGIGPGCPLAGCPLRARCVPPASAPPPVP